jgi:NADPH-dependent glutamate synthase beta subunit-like oxidoreductase/NAD-dependent dihydropyrimidine dehydrogenase PreA subunit
MRNDGTGGGSSGVVPAPRAPSPLAVSPCHLACPLGINVKAYVGLIAAGLPVEAAAVIRERNPLAHACGRVCSAPCERECMRAEGEGGAIAIRALKRFAVDVELERAAIRPPSVGERLRGNRRIAVVGAGPAGLTAAHDLARAGLPTTLFEASTSLGGLLASGMPSFRLPRTALVADIEAILALGIEVRTGRPIDLSAPEALLRDGFAAVVLAVGAAPGAAPEIPGLAPGAALDASRLVADIATGTPPPLGRRVAVVSAPGAVVLGLSAARLARRAGAEAVTLLVSGTSAALPLDEEELAGAARDGIAIRCAAGVPRASRTIDGFSLESAPSVSPAARAVVVDTVVVAGPRAVSLPGGSPLRRGALGTLAVEPTTLETSVPGVYAAGECSAGPRGVIEAMAAGRRAARSVLRLLAGRGGDRTPSPPLVPATRETGVPMPSRGGARWRPDGTSAGISARLDEPDPGLSEPQAVGEARRCRMCGPCEECRSCTPTCEFVLVADRARPSVAVRMVRPVPDGEVPLSAVVDQTRCVACGLCAEACPWAVPRLRTSPRSAVAAAIDERMCRSCGLCAGACPTAAIVQPGWPLADPSPVPPEVRP